MVGNGEDGPLWYERRGAGCRQVFSPAGAAFLSEGGQGISDGEIKMLKKLIYMYLGRRKKKKEKERDSWECHRKGVKSSKIN